ncbi:MAG: modification methylase [Deltaproteobacteria bacterium RIFOXYC2_FULL_48_10]|nr:MAG: modification methylase [Deltaproteobacteria bacterium RIFOXYC2_FULL_48_10]
MGKKSSNTALHRASKAKKDEFYTQLIDIEKELKHYKNQFRGKVVYCNCDDPFESNFFRYFAANFNAFGLKKLITTSYVKSPIAGEQLSLFEFEGLKPDGKEPFKIEISEVKDLDLDGAVGLADVELLLKLDVNASTPLKGNGDFRSEECIELLKEADIVVTNPPFSLFREYIQQLSDNNKNFLILGNQNAIKYNFVFKLIKENKLWLGYDNGGTKWFQVPDDYDIKTESRKKIENGIKYFSMGSIVWFTNLDTTKRHEKLILYKKYNPEECPVYDNYNAINVNRYIDIPYDFEGAMGVPITFVDKYNPNQFEILGIFDDKREESDAFIQGVPTYVDEQHKNYVGPVINGKALYTRVLIKNKEVAK